MEPFARTDGAWFVFKTRGYDGGTILETRPVCHEGVIFDWDIAAIVDKDGKELTIERCGTCSPGLVHVDHPVPIYPRIKGRRWWFSRYNIEFANPCDGERRKIGDFTIEVDWPKLNISSRSDWPVWVINGVGSEFTCEFRPGEEPDINICGGSGGAGVTPDTGRVRLPKSWCKCPDGPVVPEKRKSQAVRATTASPSADWAILVDLIPEVVPDIHQVAKIKYVFGKPIEESFEAEGPELETR
jgi:hypothetical protein